MPGLPQAGLSSNWKQLKEKIDGAKRAHLGVGEKRKRTSTTNNATSSLKRTKLHVKDEYLKKHNVRKMGVIPSRSAAAQDSETINGIGHPRKSTSSSRSSASIETPNGGLHATNRSGKYLSLDCEMVGTGPPPHSDNLLARASVVNYRGELIYDSYVQPIAGVEVKDYRTHVSGILPHHLAPTTARPFTTVQADISRLLDGKVIVGHALKNDLRVLLLSHPRKDIRDTSRYAKYRVDSRGRAPALRNLARTQLGLEIQTGEHSSIEDARVAMLLFQKEKAGFEEDIRRQFGSTTRPGAGKALATREKSKTVVEQDESELEDEEVDDDVDEADNAHAQDSRANGQTNANMTKPKKKKKKKRTKRK